MMRSRGWKGNGLRWAIATVRSVSGCGPLVRLSACGSPAKVVRTSFVIVG